MQSVSAAAHVDQASTKRLKNKANIYTHSQPTIESRLPTPAQNSVGRVAQIWICADTPGPLLHSHDGHAC